VEFMVDKAALEQLFLSTIPLTVPHSSPLSFGAGTIDRILADVPSGLNLTPPQEIKKLHTTNGLLSFNALQPIQAILPTAQSTYSRQNESLPNG
jgi:hypothetical protein